VRLVLTLAMAFAGTSAFGQVSPGPLARPHAALEGNANCTKCHASSKGSGMDARCLSCHEAIRKRRDAGRGLHALEGKDDCATCHPDHAGVDFALIDWPKNGPTGFDHLRKTGFELKGKHATVPCRDCHQAKHRSGSFSPTSWIGLESTCRPCHDDRHKGALGDDCARCHNPSAWSDVTGFDHAKTDFALTGKHAGLACATCHRLPDGKTTVLKPLPHAECSSCHRDAHDGRLGPKCATCHVTEGFKIVARGAFDHDKTRYPLRGAHRALACAVCHDPKKPGSAKPAFGRCDGCHADAHAGQGTLSGKSADCAACHDVAGFDVPAFTVKRHAATPFPLEAKHAAVACAKCHRPVGSPDPKRGRAGVVMRPRHDSCAACHADAHGGQFASRPDRGACESCHTAAGFAPSRMTAGEHAKLRVTLEGGHGRIACAACHGAARKSLPKPEGSARAGPAKLVFVGIETNCVDCHRDPHRLPDRACLACHTMQSFAPSTVDPAEHARFAFPLNGAHGAVPCALCHAELKATVPHGSSLVGAPEPLRTLPFRDPRRACADCHVGPHGTQFAGRKDGGRCDACHDANAFRPASRFDHARDAGFVLGTAHAALPCARCHLTRRDPSGASVVIYRGLDARCQACHVTKRPPQGGAS
jgi:hypothetical protein